MVESLVARYVVAVNCSYGTKVQLTAAVSLPATRRLLESPETPRLESIG